MAVDYTEKNFGSNLKFLCSYGGKIHLRKSDGKLRYVGGHTRVLSVDRSISFSELMKKLCDFCGYTVELKCQLPNGDLETLISVKSDEDLENIVEEYDHITTGFKIRAVLSTPRSYKHESTTTTTPTPSCSSDDRSPNSPFSVTPSPPNSPPLRYIQSSRYGLPRRLSNPRLDELRYYTSRVHKDSRLVWH